MREAFTFDDVALVPQFNNVESRLNPDLTTWLTKKVKIDIPILAANMDTIISRELAQVMIDNGSLPIFHRFSPAEDRFNLVNSYPSFMSSGIKEDDLKETRDIVEESPNLIGVVFDIAHGHDLRLMNAVESFKKDYPDLEIIAGNVCTGMAYQDLVNAGADAVKVGIGPGAVCTTRMVTGFGIPQFTAIQDCVKVAKKLRVPLIADGGIRNSRDIALALAAGASTVMIGGLFAATEEAAGNGRFRGQASEDFQLDYFGEVKKGTVAEGVDGSVEVRYSADELIANLLGGLRSAMTYGSSRNIEEFQRKAEFVKVTSNYLMESNPRI